MQSGPLDRHKALSLCWSVYAGVQLCGQYGQPIHAVSLIGDEESRDHTQHHHLLQQGETV